MTGKELKASLGLSKIKHVYIQRVLQTGTPIHIFTFDSRFKNGYLSAARVIKTKTMQINRIKKIAGLIAQRQARMTMPQRLDDINDIQFQGNEIFIMRDLAGEYMRDKKIFESVQHGLNVFYI